MNIWQLNWCGAFVLLGLVAGCGSDVSVGAVSGTARCGTTPLASGTILFESTEKVCVGTIVNGKYVLTHEGDENIPPGSYRVSVSPPPAQTIADPQTTQLRSVSSVDEKLYPVAYRNPETSGLKFEVQPGANTFDIELLP